MKTCKDHKQYKIIGGPRDHLFETAMKIAFEQNADVEFDETNLEHLMIIASLSEARLI